MGVGSFSVRLVGHEVSRSKNMEREGRSLLPPWIQPLFTNHLFTRIGTSPSLTRPSAIFRTCPLVLLDDIRAVISNPGAGCRYIANRCLAFPRFASAGRSVWVNAKTCGERLIPLGSPSPLYSRDGFYLVVAVNDSQSPGNEPGTYTLSDHRCYLRGAQAAPGIWRGLPGVPEAHTHADPMAEACLNILSS